jgi:hypothetical protein
MKRDLVEKLAEVGGAAIQLKGGVEHVKGAVADEVDDRFKAAKRAARQGRRAAEDLLDDVEYQAKRHPLGALVASLGVGLALGVILGVVLRRSGHSAG